MNPQDKQFAVLVSKYTEGRLTSEEEKQLISLLERSEACRRQAADSIALDRILTEAGKPGIDADTVMKALPGKSVASTVIRNISFTDKKKGRRRGWLQAAALLLFAVGIAALVHRMYVIKEKPRVGRIEILAGRAEVFRDGKTTALVKDMEMYSNDRIRTSDESRCLLRMPDNSCVAVNENTSFRFSESESQPSGSVVLEKGEAYFNIQPQQQKFTVQTGKEFSVDVMGTEFIVNRDRQFTAVYDGTVQVSRKNCRVTIRKGQVAYSRDSAGNVTSAMVVQQIQSVGINTDWLKPLNVDTDALLENVLASSIASLDSDDLNTDHYLVTEGTWDVVQKEGFVRITQSDPETSGGMILFAPQRWTQGVVDMKFRITARSRSKSKKKCVNGYFAFKECVSRFGLGNSLAKYRLNEWICLRIPFRVENNGIFVEKMEDWPEKDPKKKTEYHYLRTPQNSRIKVRKSCHIGLYVSGCSVEIKEFTLSNACQYSPSR